MLKKLISLLAASSLISGVPALAAEKPTSSVAFSYGETEYTREMESLERGLVAVRTDNGVYLSWRLLGTESTPDTVLSSPSFNVYRDGELIVNVSDSTNYLDTEYGESYSVAPVKNGIEGERCSEVNVLNNSYFDIPLQKPDDFTAEDGSIHTYTAGDASCGDLDGDGEYEIILKWDCNAQDNSNDGYTGNVLIDAYKTDGTLLWRIDLGRNIRGGAHYTQFLVYDFDLDGMAELCCKTAPGSKDANGDYVNQASLDGSVISGDNSAVYVDSGGRVPEGDEYYTYFESDGTAADTIFYPYSRDSNGSYWGKDTGGRIDMWNRVDRYLGAVAYIDGEYPAAITVRGYYDRTTIAAYTIENGRLTLAASHDTYDNGGIYGQYGGKYSGQGNHNITVADVDNDGRDEILTGSICFDDDLSVKWCSGRGHGDALHIGDYDPTNPGLEYFSVHESGGYTITESTTASQGQTADYGMTVYSASTGEELFHYSMTKDTGRGIMGNFGMGLYYQLGCHADGGGGSLFKVCGNGTDSDAPSQPALNFRIFWDGDLYEETLDGTSIASWNGYWMEQIFSANGCTSINGTKSNPALSADLFGDWREEVVYPLSNNSALRVFTTTELTDYKLPTLMHDPVYRSGVAAEQTAYNQPPHIGYYLSEDLFTDSIILIEAVPEKTEYEVGESLENITVTATYKSGKTEEIYDYTVSGYDPNTEGQQTITVVYGELSDTFTVTVMPASVRDIILDKDIAGIAIGRRIRLTAEIIPSNAGSTALTWTSSDPETASVDQNGNITGLKEGTAVISVTAGDVSAQCHITVKEEGSYEQIPSYIEISLPDDHVYVSDTEKTSFYGITAAVYDTFGVEVRNAEIEWSCDGDGISVEDGAINVQPNIETGVYMLTASYGNVFRSVDITAEEAEILNEIYIDEDFTNAPSFTMGTEGCSIPVGNITYCLDGGRGGGDTSTGFIPETDDRTGNTYQVFRAGRFSNSNRNPYMLLDTAPNEYDDSIDYVLTAKLCFPPSSAQYTQTMTFSDNGTAVKSIISSDFETGHWYRYSLIRHKGTWYELIYDLASDTLISFAETNVLSDSAINRIDVTSTAAGNKDEHGYNATSKVCIDDLKYYSTDNAVFDVTLTLLDEYGEPMSGEAAISGLTFVSDENGTVRTELPAGVYTAVSGSAEQNICVADDCGFTLTQPMTASVKYENGGVTIRLPETKNIFFVKYNDSVLERIETEKTDGEKFYKPDFEFDRIFIWDDYMAPAEFEVRE